MISMILKELSEYGEYVCEYSEENTGDEKHPQGNILFFAFSVHPEENEKTDARTGQEAGDHRSRTHAALKVELCYHNARGAVGYQTDKRGEKRKDRSHAYILGRRGARNSAH